MLSNRQDHPGAWVRSPLGRAVLGTERLVIRRLLAAQGGFNMLTLGDWGAGARGWPSLDFAGHQLRVTRGGGGSVRGRPERLPIESHSVDVVLMPHVLEYADDPHAVIREAHRILVPEGRLLLLGFSRFSLWGMRDLFRPVRFPWGARLLAETRIADWLRLLNMEVVEVERYFYRPPTDRAGLLRRSRFLERWGRSAWPGPWPSAGYAALARKRVPGRTVIRPAWREQQRAVSPPATAAGQGRSALRRKTGDRELG